LFLFAQFLCLISEPEKVTGLSSTSISSTSISLQWTKVSGDAYVEYVIIWESNDNGGRKTVDDGSNQTIINGLISNTNYTFRVHAKNNGSSGESSNEATFVTSNYVLLFSGMMKYYRPYSERKLGLKSNLSEICQLIASLSVILYQLNLTKLKLEYLKSGFRYKKGKI